MTTVSCFLASEAQDFDDVIDADAREHRGLTRLGPKAFGDCAAVLYYLRPTSRMPPWVPALRHSW